MKNKVLFIIVSIILIVALAGCSGGKTDEVKSSTEPGANESTKGEAENKPPVKLKIAAFTLNSVPNGIAQDPVAKYIQDKLGITMDITSVGGGDDWPQKLNALIASNDLPDIFLVTDPVKQIPQMVKAGQIQELDDLIEKYGKNILSDNSGKAMVELNRQYSTDGKLYTIGMNRGTWDAGTQQLMGHFIRWDLYKKLGYPKLENYDEDLLNVLQQMQNAEPTTKDGKKVYALGGWFADVQGWGDGALAGPLAFAEGQVGISGGDKLALADILSNTMSPNNELTDKNGMFWRSLRFYNKANRMGILDPDSFSQKADTYEDKLKAGRYLYTPLGWDIDQVNRGFEEAGMPEKGMVGVPALHTDKYILINMLPGGERVYAISKNCKYPERALELLDFLSSYEGSRLVWNGPEGVNWTMENGKPTPTDEFLQRGGDDEFKKETGAGVFHHFVGFASATIDPNTNTAVNLYEWSDKSIANKLKPVHKDMLEHYGKETLFDLYTSNVKAYKANSLFNLGELPDDLKTYDTNLQAYIYKNEFKLISAKDDDEFNKLQEQFIKGLDQFKTDEIFQYWKAKADESSIKMAPIYELLK
ncbi:extracellular solute-binding protein [Paenibacillus eucommiae]|uniref:ABC-type glycerol-3-phosphate transport system substrate-binding protein n=1 Tax=Paenibacillus eucommiae TaxID=1355755 RepID=A0ABS4IY76_9BACL|nr:extracellular solute-binding protein [Paenibacillus eucommiae]MBP1991499.1 ABC-type glycerol-3-phosphate transport system substrate-binding protein [Paenibacillus eucommiae]